MTKREYLIIDDYVDEGAITVEKLRAFVASCKRSARAAILEYIDEHESAYCAELQVVVCSSLTVPQIREVLQGSTSTNLIFRSLTLQSTIVGA